MAGIEGHTGRFAESTSGRLALVLVTMIVAGLIIIGIGSLFGTPLYEALIAWSVCTLSAMVAHVAGEYPRGEFNFAARMVLQMLVRTVPPFLLAIWGIRFAQPPLETSLVFYILAFYFVGTFTDVQLHVRRLREM